MDVDRARRDPDTGVELPSTRWVTTRRKITSPPKADSASSAARTSTQSLAARNPRDPLQVTIVYRGGPEAWVEIRARGRVYRRPGWLDIFSVLDDINSGRGGKPVPKPKADELLKMEAKAAAARRKALARATERYRK